ncbi:tubulin binding cofactor C-domain-containing protein [Halteromyces radiatus]|uniref:tubulin binding cofactor C-domain-containing protein n=1 Tax=Halteromyces radiatus TaxID=101107 RepID=UPI00221FF354|nr:tubulin binding cofactor C-domain-containing protein [Halteromyces radiatus]KAI8093284.1 tubulin binding cofactor C-domain-containing protein [Halteromyces radiatus]
MNMVEPTATEASNTFYIDFKKGKQVIEDAIEQSKQLPKDQLSDHFSSILQQINQLDKQITKATTYIPSYDERQYALQIRELTGLLDAVRMQLTPKPKFSFKSKLGKSKPKDNTVATVTTTSTLTAGPLDNISTSLLENTINFTNMENQVLTLSEKGEEVSNAVDISLSYLTRCVIWLPTKTIHISAVHIKQLKECIIVCGKVEGSILMYGLEDSILVVDCHQFRMHDAHNVDVLLHVSSRPIMEDSNDIRVGDKEQKSSTNYFDQMDDFNWLKQHASPHWKVMDNDRKEQLGYSTRSLIGLEQLDLITKT